MHRVIVVGSGPARIMAAATAAENGAQVTLLEKKEQDSPGYNGCQRPKSSAGTREWLFLPG
ncbi:MAG: NAD(P)/FAD-dependent oxidoreductase [Syntrophaceticus sp.]|nr:NAD(P)/FAD-dependent oxidoreductase [Syntrophaceticus sp.]MDD3315267.1 NAD(P)/FAD-dependent oxidoreductase [Syntrophaceticus sp.]MDD4359300.1 NAD(P)/FAD-dependent oxidoreductase [Syntrophaceticus sp.]MDD4783354.1 NAD(P)/FAD-dependent oxidoreductase [Syntrophaceticus sp.]